MDDTIKPKFKYFDLAMKKLRNKSQSEIKESNDNFSIDYRNYLKRIDEKFGSDLKINNPFYHLINKYSERGYKSPDISTKNNLFKESALLLNNNQINNINKLSIEERNKDSVFLEKIQKITSDKLSIANKDSFRDKNYSLIHEPSNYLNKLLDENIELKQQIKKIKHCYIEKIAYKEKKKIDKLSINLDSHRLRRKSGSTKFSSLDVSRTNLNDTIKYKKPSYNAEKIDSIINYNKLSDLSKKSPRLSNLKSDRSSSRNKNHIVVFRDSRQEDFINLNKDKFVINSIRNKNKEEYLNYVYDKINSRNSKYMIKDYYKTVYNKSDDELKDMLKYK